MHINKKCDLDRKISKGCNFEYNLIKLVSDD